MTDEQLTAQDQVAALLDQGEEQGCLNLSSFTELVQALELHDEEVARL